MLVSVIIPHFNNILGLTESLESVFSQSLEEMEVIIVDDASIDQRAVWEVGRKFRNKYVGKHLKIAFSGINLGPGYARNLGVSAASGNYVAFLDSGDVWHPDKLRIMSALIDKYRAVSFICHEMQALQQGENVDFSGKIQIAPSVKLRSFSLTALLSKNTIYCSSVLVRREHMVRFPLWKYGEDLYAWLKILERHHTWLKCYETLGFYDVGIAERSRISDNSRQMKQRALKIVRIYAARSRPLRRALLLVVLFVKHMVYKLH